MAISPLLVTASTMNCRASVPSRRFDHRLRHHLFLIVFLLAEFIEGRLIHINGRVRTFHYELPG
jgi:hypothetical protein